MFDPHGGDVEHYPGGFEVASGQELHITRWHFKEQFSM